MRQPAHPTRPRTQQGSDFEQLKRLAQQQDAEKQACIARNLAQKEKETVFRRAAEDARAKAERERTRELLRKREEEKKRRRLEEENLEAQREQWKKKRQEQLQKAAQLANREKEQIVTKKMIRVKEKVGLGKGAVSSKASLSSSSTYEHLPLTRQEKRERREKEMLGIPLRRSNAAVNGKGTAKGSGQEPSSEARSTAMRGPTSVTSSAEGPSNPCVAAGGSPAITRTPPSKVRSAETALQEQLDTLMLTRRKLSRLKSMKQNAVKLREAEAAEKDLRRRIAMDRKREEDRNMARIRAGLLPESPPLRHPPPPHKRDLEPQGGPSAKKARGAGESAAASAPRCETARERFLREERERKAQKKQGESSAATSGKSMRFEEDSDSDDDGYEIDDFIDDGDEGDKVDIWSIINPGKDRAKYIRPVEDSDDDKMETDMDGVFREEMRSARVAREEDKREEEALKRKELEKIKKKKKQQQQEQKKGDL